MSSCVTDKYTPSEPLVKSVNEWLASRPPTTPWWAAVTAAGLPWHLITDVEQFIGPSEQQKNVIRQLKRHLAYIAIDPLAFTPRPNPGPLYPLGSVWVYDWDLKPVSARDIGINCNKYCSRLGCGCKCDEFGVLKFHCGCGFVPDSVDSGSYAGYDIRFTIPPTLEIVPYNHSCGVLLTGHYWDRCLWSRIPSSYYDQGYPTYQYGATNATD